MYRSVYPWVLVLGLAACTRAEETEPQTAERPTPAAASGFVSIGEIPLPSQKAMPHDIAAGTDGMIWFTERRANKIGRFDPQTSTIREYAIDVPRSAPIGIAIDDSGNVWFAASAKGYIGMLEPRTGKITNYGLGDRAKDPTSLAMSADGTLWFSAERSNLVGKLVAKTHEVVLKELPAERSGPTAITLGHDGAAYVCEGASNRIARIDQKSLDVKEFMLPEGARPRGIAVGSNAALYYTDGARGKLGVLDPTTGETREWSSPSGDLSKPYGIAVSPDGRVWFSESGVRPNTLVRFEPSNNRFDEAAIPSGGGGVPGIVATVTGKIYFTSYGTDQIGVATPNDVGVLVSER